MSSTRPTIGERAYRLFQEVLEQPAADRKTWIETACGDDAGLRLDVLTLCTADERAAGLLGDLDVNPRAAPAGNPIGQRIGPYRIREIIGEGGMATVYLAERVADDFAQTVAIKLLRVGRDNAGWLARFHDECRIMAGLRHPFITQLFDAGTTAQGTPYLIMEYVQGRPIDEHCDAETLSLRDRLRLFLKICDAVSEAHRNLIVHRDLKPSNVLVTAQGTPKLLDFGIARLLEAEQIRATLAADRALTPEYASPEQISDEPVTTASDVYALGVLLYHLLTGRPVYRVENESPLSYMRAIAGQAPLPPSESILRHAVDSDQKPSPGELARLRSCSVTELRRRLAGDLDRIVLKALAKEPRQRYPSASEFAADVRRWLDGLPVEAHADSSLYRFRKLLMRNRFASTLAFLLLAALSVGLVVLSVQSAVVQQQRDAARAEAAKAQEINRFMQGMLAAADPFDGEREITVVDALKAAESRVESELGAQPAVELETLNTLARTYTGLGAIENARAVAERGLARAQAVAGADSREAATARHVLAQVHLEAGDPEQAEALLRASLAVFRANPDDWRSLAEALGDLAVVLNWTGRGEEAEALYGEAIGIYRAQTNGGLEIPLANTLNNLGIAIGMRGDHGRAEKLHREALEILRRGGKDSTPDYVQTLSSIAAVMDLQRRYTEAEPILREVLQRRLQQFGPRHQRTIWSQIALAHNLHYQQRYPEAETTIVSAIETSDAILSEKHPARAYAHVVRGSILCMSGRSVEGQQDIRFALEAREAALPAGHWLIMSTRSLLGRCLIGESRFAEAEKLLLESYQFFVTERGADDEKTVEVKDSLVALYEAWNKPDRASAYQ